MARRRMSPRRRPLRAARSRRRRACWPNPTLAFDRLQPSLLARHLASVAEPTVALALQSAHALLGQQETAWRLQDEGLLDVLGELAAPAPDSSSFAFSKETKRQALRCLEKM